MFAYCVLGVFVLVLYGFYNFITFDERADVEKNKVINNNKAKEISDKLTVIYRELSIIKNAKSNHSEDIAIIENKISNIESKLEKICDYIEENKNKNL